ncbi:MAG: zinc ribbon domain-containing protein [Pyrinomonadaceae bacterium MAG19_C2-C3]|nr:zinc ribbon domain-containing protein [Pyrinomonadaceae bacterium MAG19_C2-C3]
MSNPAFAEASASQKCHQCGLVNFGGSENCKRCDSDLTRASAQSSPKAFVNTGNLAPCADCGKTISKNAEFCPHCGCTYKRSPSQVTVDRTGWTTTIAWGIVLSSFLWLLLFILVIVLFGGLGILGGAR